MIIEIYLTYITSGGKKSHPHIDIWMYAYLNRFRNHRYQGEWCNMPNGLNKKKTTKGGEGKEKEKSWSSQLLFLWLRHDGVFSNLIASMIASDSSIQGHVGWHLRRNGSLRNEPEATFGPGWTLESIPWAPITSELPSDVTRDAGVSKAIMLAVSLSNPLLWKYTNACALHILRFAPFSFTILLSHFMWVWAPKI